MSFFGVKDVEHSVVQNHFVCGWWGSLSGVRDYRIPSAYTPVTVGGVAYKKEYDLILGIST